LTLTATASVDAAEPKSRSWGDYLRSLPDAVDAWWDPLDLFPGGVETVPRRKEPPRFFTGSERIGTGFVYQGPGPHMPVDRSFDEIVESDQPWPTNGKP
jgi:hypothetical protein